MKRFLIAGMSCALVWALAAPALAHHHPRLFTNKQGDHGGTYDNGHHTFFWFSGDAHFSHVTVCLWKHPDGKHICKQFRVHRVPAASYEPWGIDFRTDRHFDVNKGAWDLRFRHGGSDLSPILGFHRR